MGAKRAGLTALNTKRVVRSWRYGIVTMLIVSCVWSRSSRLESDIESTIISSSLSGDDCQSSCSSVKDKNSCVSL